MCPSVLLGGGGGDILRTAQPFVTKLGMEVYCIITSWSIMRFLFLNGLAKF